jgi:hypothetical protein
VIEFDNAESAKNRGGQGCAKVPKMPKFCGFAALLLFHGRSRFANATSKIAKEYDGLPWVSPQKI